MASGAAPAVGDRYVAAMLGIDGDLFHVGIRVPDLATAMDEMSRSHGVTWASVQDRPMHVWIPGRGEVTLQLALVYTCEGPTHLELMQGDPGSPWHAGDGDAFGVHHLGYWVDDVTVETERLLSLGWALELAAAPPEQGYGRFTYLRSPAGVLVEPLSRSSKPRFEAWWAGGDLASASSR